MDTKSMMNPNYPRAFISYAHEDKPLAVNIAEHLRKNGVDAWIDVWEIRAGESLIEKVFEEGLKDCAVFVIILSSASVRSPWVKHELDVAILSRIRKLTQVIPILAEECDIPVALRSLRWLNIEEGINRVVRTIVDAAYGRPSEKPIIQPPPERIKHLQVSKQGFSTEAVAIGAVIALDLDISQTSKSVYEGTALLEWLDLSPEQINDGVDELATRGLVKLGKTMGTHPFDFAWLEPTYALYYEFSEFIKDKFNPEQDTQQVAACVASKHKVDGATLVETLKIPAVRINFAVEYLSDYGVVRVLRTFGTSPFDFNEVWATSATRRFVKNM